MLTTPGLKDRLSLGDLECQVGVATTPIPRKGSQELDVSTAAFDKNTLLLAHLLTLFFTSLFPGGGFG